MSTVRYFVFDAESVADGALVAKIRYPREQLSPEEAIERYRGELMEKYDSDFIPYTFQIPISIAIAKVGSDFELQEIVVLDEPEFRPHVMTRHFWLGWEKYQQPTLVSFNGRSFDLPLLELAAFRYGVSVPKWFQSTGPKWEQPRYRYNPESHLDLQDLLTNNGATRFTGGLNLVANLLGKPGKMDVQGHMVQDMYNRGEVKQINDYCRCDVLDTYLAFLRSRVLVGAMTLEEEHVLVEQTKQFVAEQAESQPSFRMYLEAWGDWQNPWH